MKTLSLILFLVSGLAFGATAQVNSVVNFGGVKDSGQTSGPNVSTPESSHYGTGSGGVAGYKTIICGATGTAGYYLQCYDVSSGSASQYQVPSNKKFYITKIIAWTNNGITLSLGTATASFTHNSSGAPTGKVDWCGSTGDYCFFGAAYPAASAFELPITIQSSLYPWMRLNGTVGAAMLIGKEQ